MGAVNAEAAVNWCDTCQNKLPKSAPKCDHDRKRWTRVSKEEIQGGGSNHKMNRTNEWGSPEASGGVIEDLCLRGRLLDFVSISAATWQRDEDLVGQISKGLPGQFLLQVVFGWKVPEDTCTNHTSRVSAKVTFMPHFLVVSLIILQSLILTCWETGLFALLQRVGWADQHHWLTSTCSVQGYVQQLVSLASYKHSKWVDN